MTTIATNARVIRLVHGNGQGLEKWRKVIAVDVATVIPAYDEDTGDAPSIVQGTVYLVPTSMRIPGKRPWASWATHAAQWISDPSPLLEVLDRLGTRAHTADKSAADAFAYRIFTHTLDDVERAARREAQETASEHNYDQPDTTRRWGQVHKFIQECREGKHQ